MAEAFFRKYTSKKFNVFSAGTIPSSQLNPLVVKVMNEIIKEDGYIEIKNFKARYEMSRKYLVT